MNMSFFGKFFKSIFRNNKVEKILFSIPLQKNDVAIDCGANVGTVSSSLAKTGATIYSFEPNPHAFAELKKNCANTQNVVCIQKAVSTLNSQMKLYLHKDSDRDAVRWSTGSSLVVEKTNVTPDKFVLVQVIDIVEFIKSLPQRVKILKLDVEGVECQILKRIILEGVIDKIDYIFVELHDSQIPQLKKEADEIRDLVKEKKLGKIYLNWK